jgi:hypothetical protein
MAFGELIWEAFYSEFSLIRSGGAKCRKTEFFLPVSLQSPVGQGLLTVEASQSHSDTPHSVGLLWTRDQPDAEIST